MRTWLSVFVDRGYVIEQGTVVAEGQSETLLAEEGIRKAYLGL